MGLLEFDVSYTAPLVARPADKSAGVRHQDALFTVVCSTAPELEQKWSKRQLAPADPPLGNGYLTITVLSASMVTDLVTGEPFKGTILTS